MFEQVIRRIDTGKVYRLEPNGERSTCTGCAFDDAGEEGVAACINRETSACSGVEKVWKEVK